MKEMQKKQDAVANELRADMKELRQEIHAATRDIRTFTIASVVGIGVIVVGVLGFIANSIVNPPQPQIYYYPPPVQMQQSTISEDKNN